MEQLTERFEMRLRLDHKKAFEKFASENGYQSLAHLFREGAFGLMLKKSIGTSTRRIQLAQEILPRAK